MFAAQVESQRAAPKAVYSRARATRSIEYSSILYMTLFGPSHQLVAVTATTAASKNKTLQLYDPDEEVSLVKQGMTFANDWRFRWPGPKDDGLESHTLSWKRDSSLVTSSAGKNAYTCYAIRSPDPNVPLAIYKPLTGRSRQRLRYSTQVWDTQKEESGNIEGHLQMNDYNIRRLEIADLRGLEYLIIMSLSTLLDADYDDKYKTPVDNIYLSFTPAGIALQKSKGRDRASSTIKPVGYIISPCFCFPKCETLTRNFPCARTPLMRSPLKNGVKRRTMYNIACNFFAMMDPSPPTILEA